MHPLRSAVGTWCRQHRRGLRLTQAEVAPRVGVSRGYIASIETGRANPTLDIVERLGSALDLELTWSIRGPVIHGSAPIRDLVHARCSAYVDRRLRRAGWLTAREVEIVQARSHGWIDLLAFHPGSGVLIVIEIKTSIDDIGAIERQLGWYERVAPSVARRLHWRPGQVGAWLVTLASADIDDAIHRSREVFASAFPVRAPQALRSVDIGSSAPPGRAIAMVDPRSRRATWLIRTRVDGRRSPLPYVSAREAARILASSSTLASSGKGVRRA